MRFTSTAEVWNWHLHPLSTQKRQRKRPEVSSRPGDTSRLLLGVVRRQAGDRGDGFADLRFVIRHPTGACLIQHVTRRDELELVASGDFAANPDRYLKSARPPMLRDYFGIFGAKR